MSELCRSCKAPVLWAVSVNGSPIPLDLAPREDGNLRLDDSRKR